MAWLNGKPEQGLKVTHQLCFCATLIITVQPINSLIYLH